MNTDKLFKVLAIAGALTAVIAVLGRFFKARTVLGGIMPDGMAASSLMICANTVLLFAIIAKLLEKKN